MVSHLTSDGRPFHDNSNSFFFFIIIKRIDLNMIYGKLYTTKKSLIFYRFVRIKMPRTRVRNTKEMSLKANDAMCEREKMWEILLRFSFLFFVVFNDWNHRYDLERLSKMFHSMRDSLNERIYVFHNDRKIQCHSKCHQNRRPLGGALLHWRVEI